MNQWQPGQAEAMFSQPASSHLNPSALYNPNNSSANPSHFDLSAASSPFQPGLQNGGLNPQTPSAAFNNQTFQPGSVVPQKRPHDGTPTMTFSEIQDSIVTTVMTKIT